MVTRYLQKLLQRQKKSILLLGPRQTGKSTLLAQLQPDLKINLAREKEFLDHSAHPELIEEMVSNDKESPHPKRVRTRVIVDEVQRIPSILNTIQAIIDETKIQFFISGSSARKLKRGNANLLPGRIISYQLGGLSSLELDGKLDFPRSMKYGYLPEAFLEKDVRAVEDLLTSYAGVYLKEEIQAELLVRNIVGFSRFLMIFAESSGLVLDLSKVSSKAKVSRTGAARFLEILEETLLVLKCESFRGAAEADVVAHPKYYFFDPGVLNGLLGSFELPKDRLGLLFEHAVIAQLQNTAAATHQRIDFFYFRTRSGVEVDFIVRVKQNYWAIEVKSSAVDERDLKSLEAFRHYFPTVHQCVVVQLKGESRKTKTGISILSLAALLERMFKSDRR